MKIIPINEAFLEENRYSAESMEIIQQLDATYQSLFALAERMEVSCPEGVPHLPDDLRESMAKAINSTRYCRDRCGNFYRKYN